MVGHSTREEQPARITDTTRTQSSRSSLQGVTKPPSKPGSTGKGICLSGDSVGRNLCFTVSLWAAAYGVRVPDGIMATYPATMLLYTASPSRLLSLMDPLLPLSMLSKCVSAYAGGETEDHSDSDKKVMGHDGADAVGHSPALLRPPPGCLLLAHLFLELHRHKTHTSSVPMAGE
ncbi:hypothetical protein HPG69_018109 [Diceros bicornis minor]|uniref:Alpha/beta hydrolase fold-3 domain-containing protein n=1 Tax=Diceros bicornis minor TaxID=77932 RepID=A0A7J7F810_DICBM|nr:hypothetical protein HPG69_018109 [Diceros bicornis minor]